MKKQITEIAEPLTQWFHLCKRSMPWREDPTPYHVWVSEIMLQQTRVETVRGYYDRFMLRFPDIQTLAACSEEDLLKLWEGLGYYSRARNLKKCAEIICREYRGKFPDSFSEIEKLPGIGSYTAGAISSIAFHLREPVVDGNVLRVISRLTGSGKDISLQKTKKEMEDILREVLQKEELDPSVFNQALMELGALVCLPNGKPDCSACPLKESCYALKNELTEKLPVKAPKKRREIREYTVLIMEKNGCTAIVKRPDTGLLKGLYGLPMLEGMKSEEQVLDALKELGIDILAMEELPEAKHIFTHVEWHMKAYRVLPVTLPGKAFILASREELEEKYVLPTAFKKWNIAQGSFLSLQK